MWQCQPPHPSKRHGRGKEGMAVSVDQFMAFAMAVASLGNYAFCAREVRPVLDMVAASGIAVFFDRFERVGNRVPIRAGLTLLGLRWVDSVGWLATQTHLSGCVRFVAIAAQASLFFSMASAVE
jgi:hypothetical protein